MSDSVQQRADGGLLGNNGWPALSTLQGKGTRIQAQTGQGDGAGVTTPAVLPQNADGLISGGGRQTGQSGGGDERETFWHAGLILPQHLSGILTENMATPEPARPRTAGS